jgi:hypothetical protein
VKITDLTAVQKNCPCPVLVVQLRHRNVAARVITESFARTSISAACCPPQRQSRVGQSLSAAVSLGKIIVPRIVIGGVILDPPTGGRIGAVGLGSPCGYGGHGRSCPGRKKNALDSARSRLWSATSKSTTSRLAWLQSDLIVLLLYRCLVRTKSHS